ncbi:MAG: beta-N-acetylhexosaminidase [Oscillospiraceae bacterium]|nr:beta-N-acetylhexosaminidase [Oscillospiraceae bacterium]
MYDFKKALIPYPQCIEDTDKRKLLGAEAEACYKLVTECCCSDVFCEAAKLITDKLNCDCGYPIYLKICTCAGDRADSYTITITEDKAELIGYDAGGAYYAAVTFIKLLHTENGKIYLPICTIRDWPDFIDRGLFLEDRFGSDFMSLDEYKDAVDYLSLMKYNQLTIGVYGCWCVQYDNIISEYLYIPFEKYPELNTPRNIKYYSVAERKWIYKKDIMPRMFADDYFGDLIKYGKRKNIKVKPLFNSLGHNTLIPRVFPEISAKDANNNDTGNGFCTRNEKTYEIMFGIYDEIIDRYLLPNDVYALQLGLDEVPLEYFCQCSACAGTERSELMLEYIIKMVKYLKGKGMKDVYIYHDMLFHFDVLNEALVARLKAEDIYDVVVIDWWSYSNTKEHIFGGKPINGLFRAITKPFTGYYHWVIPMEYNPNIYLCAELARDHNMEGIESYSAFDYCFDRTFNYQAELSWNISMLEKADDFYDRYAYVFCPDNFEAAKDVLKRMNNIMTNANMNSFEYYWFSYPADPYPRNFPGGLFARILANRNSNIDYFNMIKAESGAAIEFFKNNTDSPQFINNVWLASAMHYYTYADEYISIVKLHESNAGKCEIIAELKRLLAQHEAFMLQIENTRIKGNQYLYLRNHTITRQFYLDTINYFETDPSPALNITDFTGSESKAFKFLR